jgi:hypothetical protein
MTIVPNNSELLWLLGLPAFLLVCLIVPLLFSWAGFRRLLVAGSLFFLYCLTSVGLLGHGIGLLMIMFSPWVAVLFVAGALFVCLRESVPPNSRPERGVAPSQVPLSDRQLALVQDLRQRGHDVTSQPDGRWAVKPAGSAITHFFSSFDELGSFARSNLGAS